MAQYAFYICMVGSLMLAYAISEAIRKIQNFVAIVASPFRALRAWSAR